MIKQHKVLKSLSKVWAVSFIALLAITVSPSIVKAEALKSGHQKMTYSVYAGGIHALNADLDIDLTKSQRFNVELYAKTHGLLGKLAPWHGTFETKGWYNKSNRTARPELHMSSTTWRDELEVKKYKYNKDGTFKEYSIKDPDNDGKAKEVDKKLTDQTTDILSATLDMMGHIAAGNECKGESEIFDGKRRYKLIFNHKKEVDLKKSKYNIYEGKAVECSIKIEPKGGRWHKKPRGWFAIQEQGREKGSMPTIWMASMTEGEPAIPVKVRAKTSYGTFFLHLTGYKAKDTKLALKD